jgi:aspartate carbamoyltransferase catalytic subunit
MLTDEGLVSAKDFTKPQLVSFFKKIQKADADRFFLAPEKTSSKTPKKQPIGILAFFEPSTRTRISFETAGLRLGIKWIHLAPESLSLKKGETDRDTFKTLACYKPDLFVVRHATSGYADLVHKWTGLPVINAGDGQHEHPTQGLLDAYTLWKNFKNKKLKIAFFGDAARNRTAKSDVPLFKALGHSLYVLDDGTEDTKLFAKAFKVKLIKRSALPEMDIIQCLRIQKERGSQAVTKPLCLKDFGKRTKLMHPGPATIGEEISAELADFNADYSLVYDQVESGLKIRTAILAEILQYSLPSSRDSKDSSLAMTKRHARGMTKGRR